MDRLRVEIHHELALHLHAAVAVGHHDARLLEREAAAGAEDPGADALGRDAQYHGAVERHREVREVREVEVELRRLRRRVGDLVVAVRQPPVLCAHYPDVAAEYVDHDLPGVGDRVFKAVLAAEVVYAQPLEAEAVPETEARRVALDHELARRDLLADLPHYESGDPLFAEEEARDKNNEHGEEHLHRLPCHLQNFFHLAAVHQAHIFVQVGSP